jgi:hypothetical protein
MAVEPDGLLFEALAAPHELSDAYASNGVFGVQQE